MAASASTKRRRLSGFRKKHIQVIGHVDTAMKNRRPSSNNDELHSGITQRLNRNLEVHCSRMRAAPLAFSTVCATKCILHTRSLGVSRNCSISSVKSIPCRLAASIRLPGAGFRNRISALANSSGVKGSSSTIAITLSFI